MAPIYKLIYFKSLLLSKFLLFFVKIKFIYKQTKIVCLKKQSRIN